MSVHVTSVHGLSTGLLTVQLINLSTPTIVLSLDNYNKLINV